jgi:hypothetical protein
MQVFFNLGCLSEKVKSCCTRLINTWGAHRTKALKQSTLLQLEQATTSLTTGTTTASSNNASNTTGSSSTSASVTTAAPTSSTKQQTAALQRQKRLKYKEHAEQLCSALYECCIQAWNVNKVLGIMVDTSASSGTHRTFLQVQKNRLQYFYDVIVLVYTIQLLLPKCQFLPLRLAECVGIILLIIHFCVSYSSRIFELWTHTISAYVQLLMYTCTILMQVVKDYASSGLQLGVYTVFWQGLAQALQTAAKTATQCSDAVAKATAIDMYPHLHKAVLHLLRRLRSSAKHDATSDLQSNMLLLKRGYYGNNSNNSGNGSGHMNSGLLGGVTLLSLNVQSDDYYSSDDDENCSADTLLQLNPSINSYNTAKTGGVTTAVSDDSKSEKDMLVSALTALRDQFLVQSLERLTRPVEQMFTQQQGYIAAVPSKHDLASFVRAMQGEIAYVTNSSTGGHITLAPYILRGIVKAVKLFCTKVRFYILQ